MVFLNQNEGVRTDRNNTFRVDVTAAAASCFHKRQSRQRAKAYSGFL